MSPNETAHMFNFKYEKPSTEIKNAAAKKAVALNLKIEEREERIRRVRAEYNITDGVFITLLEQARKQLRSVAASSTFSYSNSRVDSSGKMVEEQAVIGAGTVNMLLTERDFIESERDQVTKLNLIVRNLQDLPDDRGNIRGHKLTAEELTFLGF